MKHWREILAAACVTVLLSGVALGDAPGSVARQLKMKMRVHKAAGGETLTASLYNNRQEWESLTPEQRQQYRKEAYAMLQQSPQQQQRLLDHYSKLVQMSAQQQEAYRRRAEWLSAVVATLAPEQRQQLQAMSPEDRARKLIELRDELVRQRRLVLQPTSQPAE